MPVLGGCCCLDLKVGTKIIGILNLVSAIFSFLMSVLLFSIFEVIKPSLERALREMQYNNEALASTPNRDTRFRDYDEDISAYDRQRIADGFNWLADYLVFVPLILQIFAAILLVDIIASSCLIHAIRKNRRKLLLPWIILHWAGLIFALIIYIAVLVFLIYFQMPAVIIVVEAIAILISLALQIYLVLVVTSQYQAMGLILLHNDEMLMK